ncbi:venom phosphodiesterase 2-like [Xenia sp. Carnegie-2017]|uniref:venom phosphodiesterase 2-like n=1 Tax=Xenia sp. Carnegie-2017 TaxID=2897299 RepID=UPI001F04F61B|nr:venom phosphodiesterase 2-like [Xenia sp. Carnegie-2017]
MAKENRRKRINWIIAVLTLGILIIAGVVVAVVLLTNDNNAEKSTSMVFRYPVILISADGFRHDYLMEGLAPNITQFGKSGVRAKFMLSQFPTKTFPNHYSIVTGLYPESHGIVFNSFYDPDLRRRFSIPKSTYPKFWQAAEPIWITAKNYGIKSASYYWVGSEVEGKQPTYFRKYNQSIPFSDRVNQVLEWLKLPPEERPSFITLYFHQPDYTGHSHGPESPEVKQQIRLVDGSIGQLMNALEKMNMSDSVNIILLSDHGMADVNCNDTIYMDKYGVLANELYISNGGSVLSFNVRYKGNREKIFDKIKCKNDSFQSFYKWDLPKRMHFSNNKRIDDVIVLADVGELLSVNSSRKYPKCSRGAHGYDSILPDMWTIFMARGPSFLKDKAVEHFSNIEIYNLLAALLKIKPAPNNGTLGSLNNLLVPHARSTPSISQSDGTIFRHDICRFPNDDVLPSKQVCQSCDTSKVDMDQLNKALNITPEQGKLFEIKHLPWGTPKGGVGQKSCLLSQKHFIIAYSTILRIPLWAAYTINSTQITTNNNHPKDCYHSDFRLSHRQESNCSTYKNNRNFVIGRLVPYTDLHFDKIAMLSSSMLTNTVPMNPVFKLGIWKRLENVIRNWAMKYSLVRVITGSIFDVDENGIKDAEVSSKRRLGNLTANPAIPTHFYKIVTRCDTNIRSDYEFKECRGTIYVISFILKHRGDYCKFRSWNELLQNVAPVRDIELLTGINFFSKLPAQLQVYLKTFVPVELWK